MENDKDEYENKTCSVCKNLRFIRYGEQYCEITKLPIDLIDTCDLFTPRDEPEHLEKSNISYTKIILGVLIITFIILRFTNILSIVNKQSIYKSIPKMDSEVMFLLRDSQRIGFNSKNKHIIRSYITFDKNFSMDFFKKHLEESYLTVSDTLSRYDTIFVEDILVYSTSTKDTSKTLLYKVKGVSIKSYNFRQFSSRK
jgi:hypothetical protein